MSAYTLAIGMGNAADWVSAIATVVALIFAAAAAKATQQLYRVESERDRATAMRRHEQDMAMKRAQSALVSAWWNRRDDGDGAQIWGVYVRNASETPVYRARLCVVHLHDSSAAHEFGIAVVPPGETMFHAVQPRPVVHASRDVDSVGGDSNGDSGGGENAQYIADYRVEMSFTDSAGVRWFRDQHGKLSELRPEVLVFGDQSRAGALTDFSKAFFSSHGTRMRFQVQEFVKLREAFVESVTKDEAGEILIGPHDWIPELVQRGLLEPITISEQRLSRFRERALRGVTFEGRVYGVPYSLDTVALIRNPELAPISPPTIEAMAEAGRMLLERGLVSCPLAIWIGESGNPFNLQPFYSSGGGEIFGTDANGDVDPCDIRVATPNSIQALSRMQALGERGQCILTCDLTDDVDSIELFRHRRAAFLVAPARVLADLRDGCDVPYVVEPIPGFEGGWRPAPYVAVNAFILSTRGDNKIIAHDMVADYMSREDVVMSLYEVQPRPLALRALGDRLQGTDFGVSTFHQECMRGPLIPLLPQMADVWRLLGLAQVDVIRGASPAAVARRLHHDLSQL